MAKKNEWKPTSWDDAYRGLVKAGHTDASARAWIADNTSFTEPADEVAQDADNDAPAPGEKPADDTEVDITAGVPDASGAEGNVEASSPPSGGTDTGTAGNLAPGTQAASVPAGDVNLGTTATEPQPEPDVTPAAATPSADAVDPKPGAVNPTDTPNEPGSLASGDADAVAAHDAANPPVSVEAAAPVDGDGNNAPVVVAPLDVTHSSGASDATLPLSAPGGGNNVPADATVGAVGAASGSDAPAPDTSAMNVTRAEFDALKQRVAALEAVPAAGMIGAHTVP